ncbi:MAG: hypothetical protein MZU97_03650 [Bacillus subtilis]|nr:hypothetical protein [Bacillus subtilis]
MFDRMVYKPKQETYTLPRSNFIKRISHELETCSNKLRTYTQELNEIESLFLDIETPPCIQTKPIKEITIRPCYDGRFMEVIYVYQEEAKKTKTNTQERDDGHRLRL